MKRFLLEVLAVVAAQALLMAALERTYDRRLGTRHYLAALEDKERLQRATRPPRVLLVGGSSLAFGVNSRALERSWGVPVVNLALHAGLGLELLLRQAARALVPGDRVVRSLEYWLFKDGFPFDSATLWQEIATVPSSARDLGPRSVPTLLDDGLVLPRQRLVALWSSLVDGPSTSIYRRDAFDERGDFVAHLDLHVPPPTDHARIPSADELDDACGRLAEFAQRARALGVEVLLMPAPVPDDDLQPRREEVERVWRTVSERTGLPVTPVLPLDRSSFFDSAYHLNREGRRARTDEILRAMGAARTAAVAPSN